MAPVLPEDIGGVEEANTEMDLSIPKMTHNTEKWIELENEKQEDDVIFCQEEANKVLDEMQKRGFQPSLKLYEAKVAALCKDCRVDEAGVVIEEEMLKNNCVPDSRDYSVVVKGFCNCGKSGLAMRFLEMMDKQKWSTPDKETLGVMVGCLCQDKPSKIA